MEITKTENYTILKPIDSSLKKFLKNLEDNLLEFKNQHLILDFSEKINTNIKELLLFLNINNQHRENGTSFVIIIDGIEIDEIPDEMNIVPTFTEAIDILEMDAIERDLGF
ncbi:ribonuclease Z [Lutibacter sp. A80]|uniref:ribonuclease Z n=1 Tax=Lutibacter sp. A80 TaxID=2918453 RepID=UPI001F0515F6|nr:ribonuclease Z [Lutibacter sp. A80]UMB60459.1 ribonuclease Z [Lutibacter sp. A80]